MIYENFFKAATGFEPFPFQLAFHHRDRTLKTHTLTAPTGLGKTETIVCDWLYGILHDRKSTPTRLILMLPMRSLTHQTKERVDVMLQRFPNRDISTHLLVGGTGAPLDREWLDCVDRPCIIVGTQDQILSRQLYRGYGSSRWEWAMHGALLNNDARIVCDETQLMGVGYRTAVILQSLRQDHSELILCCRVSNSFSFRLTLLFAL